MVAHPVTTPSAGMQSVSKSKLLDCGGTDAALAFGETDPFVEPAKAPSPLRSAGALHRRCVPLSAMLSRQLISALADRFQVAP